jgi:hypothetical protein
MTEPTKRDPFALLGKLGKLGELMDRARRAQARAANPHEIEMVEVAPQTFAPKTRAQLRAQNSGAALRNVFDDMRRILNSEDDQDDDR